MAAARGGTERPVALPGAYPAEGASPLLAHLFDDGSYDPDGKIIRWEWNFGDQHDGRGGWHDFTESAGDAWHTYHNPGTKIAQLRVTDNDGNKDLAAVQIKIRSGLNAAPWAAGDATVVEGLAVLSVSFCAEGSYDPDGDIQQWEWDFGDGGGWEDFSPTAGAAFHTYDQAREYYPRLRVTDDDGAASEATVLIYEILHEAPYDPATGLQLDLGDGSYLLFPPGMLTAAADITVYEGHKFAPWVLYVTEPVRIEVTLANGGEAPGITAYQYGYNTAQGYSENYDLNYFDAPPAAAPTAQFGWTQPDANYQLTKVIQHSPHQHLSLWNLVEPRLPSRLASSAYFTGLEYPAGEDLTKPIHVVFVHGMDETLDMLNLPHRSPHWWHYAPLDDPYRILDEVADADTRANVAIGWFYYQTMWSRVFGTQGSGYYLAAEIEDKIFSANPAADVILVGYSMGGLVIRSAYDWLAQDPTYGPDAVDGIITLSGANNGDDAVNFALNCPQWLWLPFARTPGIIDSRSIYDIQHFLIPLPFSDNANEELYDIVNDPLLMASMWDSDRFIRLATYLDHTPLSLPGLVFDGITLLRAPSDSGPGVPAPASFLRAGNPRSLTDWWVPTGSQLAVALEDTTFDDSRDTEYDPGDTQIWHAYDHFEVRDDRKSDVDLNLQKALAYLVELAWNN